MAVIELAALRAVHEHAPGVPRSADPVHRRRAQHDRGDDADREPAAAVAAADDRAADAADRAPAHERGAGVEGQAARRAERRGRAQEQGGRAGAARPRGEGGRAGAHLQVQVRVPREHVARAPDAAQLDPHPGAAAGRERGRQPDDQADRVRQEHPLGGHRPSDADQRHPGPVEDRVGHGHRRARGDHLRLAARQRSSNVPPHRRGQVAGVQRGHRSRRCRARSTATPSVCSRSSRTCCRTRSSSRRRGTCR